jgi:two-component sensor histidine kinase
MPVLLLGVAQSAVAFRRDGEERRTNLIAAAERGSYVAHARMQSAELLLETLGPETVGLQCSPRLAQAMTRSPVFGNLIRLDPHGRLACAARTVGADPGRYLSPWFQALKGGQEAMIARVDAGPYASEPSALIAVRATGADGGFDGVLAAVLPLRRLRADLEDRTLPRGAEMALADRDGRYLLRTAPRAFAPIPPGYTARDVVPGSQPKVFHAKDLTGAARVYVAAPLMGEVTVVLSEPEQGLFSWAWLNPLSGLLLPFTAFFLALMAVWVVADRVVVRWLHYLDRIAAIYARGRFTVRPLQAEWAPPEVRALAHTLDVMAEAIVARDQSLRDSLAQKDALLREIHHRVKNNLQVITSLLNMQQRALSDPAARAAISDTRQRIGALAVIYRALYQGPDLRRVDLRPFLEELTAQVVAAESSHAPIIRTDVQAEALSVDPDKLAPIALFAVEAISNAQKHAFGPSGGALHVRFWLEGNEASLEISDDGGQGQPAEINDGVGRTLMNAFARQLRGRCEIVPNARGGLTARLTFPVPEAPPKTRPAKAGAGFAA